MPTPGWLTMADLPRDALSRVLIDPDSLEQMLDQYHNYRGDVNMGGFNLTNVGNVFYASIGVDAGPAGASRFVVKAGGAQGSLALTEWQSSAGVLEAAVYAGGRFDAKRLVINTTDAHPTDSIQVGGNVRIATGSLIFPDGSSLTTAPIITGLVPNTRSILTSTGLTGGGNLTADRTLSVVADTTVQQIRVSVGGTLIGTRREINIIQGTGTVITGADSSGSNRVDVTINSTGGGAGGSQTPWLSDIAAATFKLFNVGAIGVRTSTVPVGHTAAGRTYVTIRGVSDAGVLELCNTATDADLLTVGQLAFTDPNNTTALEKRIALIVGATSGSTANNRGGMLQFLTRVDNSAGPAEAMRLTANARLGIAATAPGLRLEVTGVLGAPAGSGTTQTGVARFSVASNVGALDVGYATTGAWLQAVSTADLSVKNTMTLNPLGGNVGVGQATPLDPVHIYAPAAWGIRIQNAGDNGYLRVSSQQLSSFTAAGGALTMFIQDAGGTAVVCRNGGNVGIGTGNPGNGLGFDYTILHVKGSVSDSSHWSGRIFGSGLNYGVAIGEFAANYPMVAGMNSSMTTVVPLLINQNQSVYIGYLPLASFATANVPNGTICMVHDDSANNIRFYVRTSSGTLKSCFITTS